MKFKNITKKIKDREVVLLYPDTTELNQYDFSFICHSVHKNDPDSKHGKYAIQFKFGHDDVAVTNKGKLLTGGIDHKTKSYANAQKGLLGVRRYKNAASKRDHIEWADKAKQWAKEKVMAHYDKKKRKRPVHYTSPIKHEVGKVLLDNSMVLFIELNDHVEIHVMIGDIEYSFDAYFVHDVFQYTLRSHTLDDDDDDWSDWDDIEPTECNPSEPSVDDYKTIETPVSVERDALAEQEQLIDDELDAIMAQMNLEELE
ncbi:hypothetical protein QTO12_05930 [Vibrio owensii]|uniref:hypothetical protein n=1 Tax=Vibrio owensii TaxID=696485 RepID=UPI002F40BF6E